MLSLSIALCFAEVGGRFETTGGPYLPARAAFGRFVGFETGWMMWFARVTSHASVVNALTITLALYWPPLASGIPRAATISALTLVLTWINVIGIKQSSWFVNALTIGKLLPLAIFIAVGIWFIDPGNFSDMPPVSREQVSAAALLLIFAYGGYEVTGVLAGEAANPRKDVPFAFVAVLIIVSIVMSLASLVATGLLPDLATTERPLATGAAMFLGAFGAAMISPGAVVSMTGNNMGQLLNGSHDFRAGRERRPRAGSAGSIRNTAPSAPSVRRRRRARLALSGLSWRWPTSARCAAGDARRCMSTLVLQARSRNRRAGHAIFDPRRPSRR